MNMRCFAVSYQSQSHHKDSLHHLLFKPVGDHDTEDVQGEFNGDELPTGFVFSSLSSPDRHNRVKDTSTPAVDETSEDHPGGVHSRGLKTSTEDSPSSTKRNGLYAAVFVTEPTTNETADQGTDVVDRDLTVCQDILKYLQAFEILTIPPCRRVSSMIGAFSGGGPVWPNFMVSR